MESKKSKMKSRKILGTIALAGIFLFSASQVLAACPTGIVPCGTPDCPCNFCDIFKLIHNIVNFLLLPCSLNNNIPLIPAIAGLMSEMFSKAKSILTATIVGLVIIFLAWVFLNTFFDYIGVAEWTGLGSWWQIDCH